MKRYPLLTATPDTLSGRPRIAGTRLSTEHVWRWCAGQDTPAHVKEFQRNWSEVTQEQVSQAVAFERERREGATRMSVEARGKARRKAAEEAAAE